MGKSLLKEKNGDQVKSISCIFTFFAFEIPVGTVVLISKFG